MRKADSYFNKHNCNKYLLENEQLMCKTYLRKNIERFQVYYEVMYSYIYSKDDTMGFYQNLR